MSIEIEKPAPFMVGDKAYYTLSSYEPVSVEVEVPYVTDFDVDVALSAMVREAGGTPTDLLNPSWVSAHFDGIPHAAALREDVRERIEQMNSLLAEEQKLTSCVDELVKRLKQAVPAEHIARARQGVEFTLRQQLTVEGLSLDDFLLRSGMTPADYSVMLDQQAKDSCERNAALDAFARDRKLSVSEEEFGPLLGIPEDKVDAAIAQVRATGQYDQMREAALHAKAAQVVVAECTCTYRHETPDEARRRVRQFEAFQRELEQGGAAPQGGGPGTQGVSGSNPAGLHLVR